MTRASLVIPAFNAGTFLKEAVQSAVRELPPDCEVIVVDDGSTDGSADGLEKAPVRVLRRQNGGEASARNAGIRAARGEFVTFLDADDLLSPRSLQTRIDWLEKHPAAWAVGGLPSRLLDGSGQALASVLEPMSRKYGVPFLLTREFYRSGRFFPVSCALYLYRREVFSEVGGFDVRLQIAPDCDFHFRLLRETDIPIEPIAVFDRRIHAHNLSLNGAVPSDPKFRPEVLEALREINRANGFHPAEIRPWEAEYL